MCYVRARVVAWTWLAAVADEVCVPVEALAARLATLEASTSTVDPRTFAELDEAVRRLSPMA